MAELSNSLSIPRANRLFVPKKIAASCPGPEVVGDVVYISGESAGLPVVTLADPDDSSALPGIGFICEKVGTACKVQVAGPNDTIFSGMTPGAILYVGVGGALSEVPGRISQVIGYAITATSLMVEPDFNILSSRNYRVGISLAVTGNPRIWTVPEVFHHTPGELTIELFHNGHRLAQSASGGPQDGNYVAEESVPTMGYDQVRVFFTPGAKSVFRANFFAG